MMDPYIIGSAISAVGNVASKLFGGGSKSSGRIDLKQLVKDAERAGFNPLTVLRNGGAAGYQQTHHPAFSTAEVVGEALGGIGNTIAGYDPHAEARRTLETDLAKAQIANLQADTAARNRASIGGVPTWTGSSVKHTGPALSQNLPGVGTVNSTLMPTIEQPGASNPFPHGSGGVVSGNVPDLETGAEARYGDFVSIPFGVFNLGADLYSNFRKYRPDPWSPANTRKMNDFTKSMRKSLGHKSGDPFAAWGY